MTPRTIEKVCAKLLTDAKYRAKKRGLDFDLDRAWLIEKLSTAKCELSGVTLDFTTGSPFAMILTKPPAINVAFRPATSTSAPRMMPTAAQSVVRSDVALHRHLIPNQ